ncbi:hypothetical protein BN1723_009406, partial [Verticillium longisporum]
ASGEGRSKVYQFWLKVCAVFRPVKLLGGILLLLIALFIWVSMLITGIDKAKNSICKQRCGYILGHLNIFQPINWVFLKSARAFPVDYILMTLLVLFLFSSSITGIAAVGIRFLWVRIFQIRRGRTAPQALLIATVMLALIILAINYSIAMLIAPQYAIYGTQTWCSAPHGHGERPDCRHRPDYLVSCSEALSKEARSVCTPSVMSEFLNRVTITWPFFGAVAFWAQFAFLAVFLVVFVTGLFRTPKLNLSELDDDAEADEEEGLLASTGRRFGATWQDMTGRTGRNGDYGTQGASAQFGGGRYYGGGAVAPYRAGNRSPVGFIAPFVLVGAAALYFWPGSWYGHRVQHYEFNNTHTFFNESANENQTKPVICGCIEELPCGCDEPQDRGDRDAFLNELIGNGSYAALNKSVID